MGTCLKLSVTQSKKIALFEWHPPSFCNFHFPPKIKWKINLGLLSSSSFHSQEFTFSSMPCFYQDQLFLLWLQLQGKSSTRQWHQLTSATATLLLILMLTGIHGLVLVTQASHKAFLHQCPKIQRKDHHNFQKSKKQHSRSHCSGRAHRALHSTWIQRSFLNLAAQAADKYKYPRVFWSQLITSNTLFVFHWTLWSIYKLFIIQLLEVSQSTSVSSKTVQVSSMKTHVKSLSCSSLLTAFLDYKSQISA